MSVSIWQLMTFKNISLKWPNNSLWKNSAWCLIARKSKSMIKLRNWILNTFSFYRKKCLLSKRKMTKLLNWMVHWLQWKMMWMKLKQSLMIWRMNALNGRWRLIILRKKQINLLLLWRKKSKRGKKWKISWPNLRKNILFYAIIVKNRRELIRS